MATIFKRQDKKENCWTVQWMESGKRKSKSFTGQDAELEATKWKNTLENNKNNTPKEQPKTLEDIWNKWQIIKKEKRSMSKDVSNYSNHLAPFFGKDRPLSDFNRELCLDFIEHQKNKKAIGNGIHKGEKQNIVGNTINLQRSLLLSLLKEAEKLEWISRVPSIDKAPKGIQKRDFFKSKEEIDKFMESTKVEPFAIQAFYFVALHTALRPGELRQLDWHDVDFDNKVIHITCDKDFTTKNGEDRDVPMTDEVIRVLEQLKKYNGHQDIVFPNKHGRHKAEKDKVFTDTWKRIKERAGFKNRKYLVFYSCRHTCITRWLEKGISAPIIQRWAAHANFSTTLIYARHVSADWKYDMELLNKE